MLKILADAHIPYMKGVAEQLGEVEYLPGNQFTREAIRDKDALVVRTVTHFDEKILSGSNVKLICSATIGYDHIDTEYCDAHGIAWRTAPGCNANSVEQYITASLLYLAEKYDFDLTKQTIGIVGVGNVGSRVAVACEKLGMRVLLNDPPREEREGTGGFTNIETIQREANIITFHTPLTRTGKHATLHLLDDSFLERTECQPFIINAARGGVTSNRSLVKALKEKRISGAVMDCWENEPTIDGELLKMADIATPHIAGYSADGKWNATQMSLQNMNEYFNLGVDMHYQSIPSLPYSSIDLKGVPREEQLANAVWRTYHPEAETKALKERPEDFYWFRSNYPLRREYRAFDVQNADSSVERILRELGFK